MWKNINDNYKIDEYGNIFSSKKNGLKSFSFDKRGYKTITLWIDGKQKFFRIHTLVWDYFGDEPRNGRILQVDHKDNDKLNNHISNLHLVDTRYNCSKRSKQYNKTSKYTGVSWSKDRNKWVAQIKYGNETKNLGRYDNEYDAHLEYKKELFKYVKNIT